MSSFHSWLPVALPADAHRIRVVDDPELAAVLTDAGAEIVDVRPDVEIVYRRSDLRHDAPHAIILLGTNQPEGGDRLLRARRRATSSAGMRSRARTASLRLRTQGYRSVRVIPWDYDQPIQLPGATPAGRRRLAELLPERSVVVAHRSRSTETLLERVIAEASEVIGRPINYSWPLIRAGVLVVVADTCVVRIAVGAAGQRLATQRRVLGALESAPHAVRSLLPIPVHGDRSGLALWTVEPRVVGTPVADEMSAEFSRECMDFLARLHSVPCDGPERSLVADAQRCGELCPTDRQQADLVALGEQLAETLRDVPRGFGHGDFWVENLFCDGQHLSGVIDWDGGGPGRLPLIDLIHLQVSGFRAGGHATLGSALLESQFEAARAGGDELTREYCRRVGLDPDPEILEALVLAFWIDRTALELELRPDLMNPNWVEENITVVLDHLRRDGRLPRGAARPR